MAYMLFLILNRLLWMSHNLFISPHSDGNYKENVIYCEQNVWYFEQNVQYYEVNVRYYEENVRYYA